MDLIQSFKEKLSYCPDTGVLSWKEDESKRPQWNGRYANKPVGCVGNHGYICFNFTHNGEKKQYLVHRVVYAMMHGSWPKEVDHKDRDKTNNRLNNLRECSSSSNGANIPVRKHNKLGVKGVSYVGEKVSGEKRYVAQSSIKGRRIYLGTFSTEELAKSAYDEFAKKQFGEFFHE